MNPACLPRSKSTKTRKERDISERKRCRRDVLKRSAPLPKGLERESKNKPENKFVSTEVMEEKRMNQTPGKKKRIVGKIHERERERTRNLKKKPLKNNKYC